MNAGVLLLLLTNIINITYSQTLDICQSGNCYWNDPGSNIIPVCTNTAISCTVAINGDHTNGKVYSAAPKTRIDCYNTNGCQGGEYHCGDELPPNYSSYDLTESDFINREQIDCHFHCDDGVKTKNVCKSTDFYCTGDISHCFVESSKGESCDSSSLYCNGITNPNGTCSYQCDGKLSCDNALLNCTNTMAICSSNGNRADSVTIVTDNSVGTVTAIPTVSSFSSYPTEYPIVSKESQNTIMEPTDRPTNQPIAPTKMPSNLYIAPTNTPNVQPTYEPTYEPTQTQNNNLYMSATNMQTAETTHKQSNPEFDARVTRANDEDDNNYQDEIGNDRPTVKITNRKDLVLFVIGCCIVFCCIALVFIIVCSNKKNKKIQSQLIYLDKTRSLSDDNYYSDTMESNVLKRTGSACTSYSQLIQERLGILRTNSNSMQRVSSQSIEYSNSVRSESNSVEIPVNIFEANHDKALHRKSKRKLLLKYTMEEVKQHRNKKSCWIIVDNVILDVTKFLKYHPAGIESITKWGGTICDEHFSMHSPAGKELFFKFVIGRVEKGSSCGCCCF